MKATNINYTSSLDSMQWQDGSCVLSMLSCIFTNLVLISIFFMVIFDPVFP